MRLAIFVTFRGVEKVIPDTDSLDDTEAALRLYHLLRDEIRQFDLACRRRLAEEEATGGVASGWKGSARTPPGVPVA
jgi:hypothetical protein